MNLFEYTLLYIFIIIPHTIVVLVSFNHFLYKSSLDIIQIWP